VLRFLSSKISSQINEFIQIVYQRGKERRVKMGGKLTEQLSRLWKMYIEFNRSMTIFLTGLLAVLFFIAAIRVSIEMKIYDGLLLLVVVLILLGVTIWIAKNIQKPS